MIKPAADHGRRASWREICATLLFCSLALVSFAGPPIIGINTDVRRPSATSTTLESASVSSFSTPAEYVDAVVRAGGVPVLIPPTLDPEALHRQVEACDGFVLIGGADIDPARYNEEPHPKFNRMHPRRESGDFALVDEIMHSEKPFLAVCLGSQMVNVALGGNLIQDIAAETTSTINHQQKDNTPGATAHEVIIEKGTKLYDLLGTTTLRVNSRHHQATKNSGKGLRLSARAPDGIIEALELQDRPVGIAVQWHPEDLPDDPVHQRLYRGLVEAAARHRGH